MKVKRIKKQEPIVTLDGLTSSELKRKTLTHDLYKKEVNNLAQHSYCYYELSNPQITDFEYDYRYRRLEKYEEKYPNNISPISPTRRLEGWTEDLFTWTFKKPENMNK